MSMVRRNQGFTLVEVMLAMVILAILGIASTTVLSQMLDSSRASETQHNRLSELQFAMLTLERDVRQMSIRPTRRVPPEARNYYVSNDRDLLDSDSGALAFIRAGWHNPQHMLPRSQLQPVVYRVREGVLQRLHWPFVDDSGTEPAIQNLLENVTSFNVRFQVDGEMVDEWRLQHHLPDLVHIEIEHSDFGLINRVILTSGLKTVQFP